MDLLHNITKTTIENFLLKSPMFPCPLKFKLSEAIPICCPLKTKVTMCIDKTTVTPSQAANCSGMFGITPNTIGAPCHSSELGNTLGITSFLLQQALRH